MVSNALLKSPLTTVTAQQAATAAQVQAQAQAQAQAHAQLVAQQQGTYSALTAAGRAGTLQTLALPAG